MDYMKIFEEWYEFSCEDYLRMEKALRRLDGKKRLIKVKRKGIFEKLLLGKWKIDANDEDFKALVKDVRWKLGCYLCNDEGMLQYIDRYGVVNSADVLYCWTQKNIKKAIREAL